MARILIIYELASFLLYVLPVLIVARLIAIYLQKRNGNKTTALHEAGILLLCVYVVVLLHITVNYWQLFRLEFALSDDYNFIPFRGIADILRSADPTYIVRNIAGNIVLFLPLGLLLPLLWRGWTLGKTVLAGAAFSFIIEFTQLFTSRGTDIDDLLLNTLGTLCGYGLYLLLRKALPKVAAGCRVRADNAG